MRRNQMKWELGRRVMAILLSLVLILSSTGIAVFAEGIPDANADLISDRDASASQEVVTEDTSSSGAEDTAPPEKVTTESDADQAEEDPRTDGSAGRSTQ